MLKKIEKHVQLIAFIAIIIFLFLCSLDILNFAKWQKNKYANIIKEYSPTENMYAKVCTSLNTNIREEEEIKKITNIDIYSTNPWRIKIPVLRLDAPITEGTTQESMRRTVGHFEDTDKWNGNVALAGHNRGYKCNFFQKIKDLKKGDIIIYCTEKGERKYSVIVNTLIKETDWSYIKNTKDNRITLITCESGKREYRRCIQAVEVKINS